ncbi:nitroreductase family protein [Mesoterricola sediminis]|uniref:Nitroreductase domain-containing protein n=1 Tax=Mesoterricola sediminis TaxID=2927980 RepID=A0AA48H4G7_9BACT|nr:nitroreductase family protein [Mesoterricola sediminis]BDU77281.1 hypothetical protein METESE_22390 [Mesoterricola sediminis]
MRPVLALLCGAALLGAQDPIQLPAPAPRGTLAEALKARATVRALAGPAPTLAETAQLLWAAQGENRPGKRTVPSAKARYPLDLYLVTAGTPGLPAGVYRYLPAGHALVRVAGGGPAEVLGGLKAMQPWIAAAPAVAVVAATPRRIDGAGQEDAVRLAAYEAGAAAQALLLQAAALELGAGTAVGVDLAAVGQALKLPEGARAVALLPIGHRAR